MFDSQFQVFFELHLAYPYLTDHGFRDVSSIVGKTDGDGEVLPYQG